MHYLAPVTVLYHINVINMFVINSHILQLPLKLIQGRDLIDIKVSGLNSSMKMPLNCVMLGL
jgi:hypothetical protein